MKAHEIYKVLERITTASPDTDTVERRGLFVRLPIISSIKLPLNQILYVNKSRLRSLDERKKSIISFKISSTFKNKVILETHIETYYI